MDPINVATSLVGLLGSAGRVVVLLLAVKKSIGEAPRMMNQMVSQVRELEICLSAVQSFLLGINSAPRRRISMIRVEQLVAILTEAVLTFSELEVLVTSIAKDKGRLPITSRLTTLWKEDIVTSIMLRLERHRSSLSLMLNIAQCESDLEAEQSRETLQSLVEQLLRSNHDISLRLQSIEENFETGSVITYCFRNGSMPDFPEGEAHAERSSQLEFNSVENSSHGSNIPTEGRAGYRTGFEVDLGTSRVYRRTERFKSDVSFTSSAIRSHAWSIFSGLSLSEVSMLSAIALPLYLNEIYNNKWYSTLSPRPFVEDEMKSLPRESSTSHIPSYDPPVPVSSTGIRLYLRHVLLRPRLRYYKHNYFLRKRIQTRRDHPRQFPILIHTPRVQLRQKRRKEHIVRRNPIRLLLCSQIHQKKMKIEIQVAHLPRDEDVDKI
ncbi:hypothetical protein BGZ57DRAFT_631001 [Hyaloscypha finlandica]|nr:hypothetical protein BGZ57DRAFT_631001 [Hyaloscypha finlandica]